MSTTIDRLAVTDLPAGVWQLDPVHSSFDFAVRHMVVSTFRGSFKDATASLTPERLSGAVAVSSVSVDDPNLAGHLLAPDFFDGERHPDLTFDSTEIRRTGDDVEIDGELTIKGLSRPITLTGTISGPVTDFNGKERVGLQVETTIDRRDFGLDWQAPLPGGGVVLGYDVTLTGDLQFVEAA